MATTNHNHSGNRCRYFRLAPRSNQQKWLQLSTILKNQGIEAILFIEEIGQPRSFFLGGLKKSLAAGGSGRWYIFRKILLRLVQCI